MYDYIGHMPMKSVLLLAQLQPIPATYECGLSVNPLSIVSGKSRNTDFYVKFDF